MEYVRAIGDVRCALDDCRRYSGHGGSGPGETEGDSNDELDDDDDDEEME